MSESIYIQQISNEKELGKSLVENIAENQNNFIGEQIVNALNAGLDWGIRVICPDFIEDQVINLKNNILNQGLIGGIGQTVNDIVDFGKSILGIKTENLESIEQAKNVIKEGGTSNKISELLQNGIDRLKEKGTISKELSSNLKEQNNEIIKNVEENLDKSFSTQLKNINKLEKYIINWKEYYQKENFSGMQKEFNKMNKVIDSLMPLENIINEFRTIENLQNLIKNNGKKFNLSSEEIELANKLIN